MKNRTKGLVIGGAILAVIAVVYFSFFYPPPSGEETAGTVGGVKKYRAPQITEKDVVLEGQQSTESQPADQVSADDEATFERAERDFAEAVAVLETAQRALQGKMVDRKLVSAELEKAASRISLAAERVSKLSSLRHYDRALATLKEAAKTVQLSAEKVSKLQTTKVAQSLAKVTSELRQVGRSLRNREGFERALNRLSEATAELSRTARAGMQEKGARE